MENEKTKALMIELEKLGYIHIFPGSQSMIMPKNPVLYVNKANGNTILTGNIEIIVFYQSLREDWTLIGRVDFRVNGSYKRGDGRIVEALHMLNKSRSYHEIQEIDEVLDDLTNWRQYVRDTLATYELVM